MLFRNSGPSLFSGSLIGDLLRSFVNAVLGFVFHFARGMLRGFTGIFGRILDIRAGTLHILLDGLRESSTGEKGQ
jgi:hypothetical protein